MCVIVIRVDYCIQKYHGSSGRRLTLWSIGDADPISIQKCLGGINVPLDDDLINAAE